MIWRLRLIRLSFLALALLLLTKLFSLQILKSGEKWRERGKEQYLVHVKLMGRRGEILDRKGRSLAMNIPGIDLFQIAPVYASLPISGKRVRKPLKAMGKRKVYPLAYGLPYELRDTFETIKGVYIHEGWKRFYPYGDITLPLLGDVGLEGKGLDGIEYLFDDFLSGKSGFEVFLRTSSGKRLVSPDLPTKPALNGRSMMLTIDADLQELAYREIKRRVEEEDALSGFVIVLNPKDGSILALAQAENPRRNKGICRKNKAVVDPYEPGSTFKIVTYSAALTSGIHLYDTIDVTDGYVEIQGHLLKDSHPLKRKISCEEAIVHSSNVAAAKLGLKLGPKKLYEMARKYGIGSRTGISIPGEGCGRLPPPQTWMPIHTANVAMGQGVLVNGIQMALAYAAVANGGYLLAPKLILGYDGKDGFQKNEGPLVIRRVIDKKIAKELKEAFIKVIEDSIIGTGRYARIPGVISAGKTGTGQKVDPETGKYSWHKIIASFIGFFPAYDPEYLIYVVIDEPKKGRYGGTAAAPVFRRLAMDILFSQGIAINRGPA